MPVDSRPVLRVVFHYITVGEILASGIVEDADMFRNAHFASLDEMIQYLGRRYSQVYRIIVVESRKTKGLTP